MKTILYQPLFINPQAYFVFPQLYHIEKGDSYIEPANITGQLIINDLTQSLTSTPILNVVQDTNQVDFGLFKGKHIRISQYTNIGAVVLGEWYVPGTPTPPEPEQPDWFKESIVAWYSPYCKQRMTNFDVIESYADDFTKWKIENTGVTSTQKKIVIAAGTELKYNVAYRGFGNSIAEFDIKYTGNAVIRYRYNKEDDTTGIITINRSGIYHLPASIKTQKNFGFYCNPQTVTEEATIEQLPTSILKDFSGNGNHAYLYGGNGKLNSGMGLYKVDFTSWRKSSVQTEVKPDVVKVTPNTSNYLFVQYASSAEIPSYKIKVIGLGDNVLKYQYATENGRKEINIVEGENELPTSIKVSNDYQIGYRLTPGTSVFTITQIPDYPDQLCYDGSMCAVVYEFPILTDYTIIADRTWFNIRDISCFIGKRNTSGDNLGAFEFEFRANRTFSFGGNNVIIFADNNIVYQTKNSYNGTEIKPGSLDDTDVLIIGAAQRNVNNKIQDPYIGCHGNILIFNRTLTDDELSVIKEVVFGISDIKDALLTVDKKYIKLNDNNYIKLNK